MNDFADRNPVQRFDGLAEVYDRCRPHYPVEAVGFILRTCGLQPGMCVVDVGCGTGISSRQLARAGLHVIGLEPNAEMRRSAASTPCEGAAQAPDFRNGRAENTGLADSCADAVVAAQAFHWFDPDTALLEFHRILKPGGWVVLMWNEQDRRDPFTAAYAEAMIRYSPSPEIAADRHSSHGGVLLGFAQFENADSREFPNEQTLTREELLGRAFSASYAPKEADTRRGLTEQLTRLHESNQRDGRATLRYLTTVYVAQRRASVSQAGG